MILLHQEMNKARHANSKGRSERTSSPLPPDLRSAWSEKSPGGRSPSRLGSCWRARSSTSYPCTDGALKDAQDTGLAKLPHGTHNQVRLIDCRIAAMADGDPCTGFVVFDLVARLMDQHPRPVAFLASKT